jgi:branched-chain amino acid transport system substrate-binding protein
MILFGNTLARINYVESPKVTIFSGSSNDIGKRGGFTVVPRSLCIICIRRKAWFYSILFVVLVLFGCGKSPENRAVKLGLIEPMTGDLALYGKPVSQGAAFAVQEANKQSSHKYKFELVSEDIGSRPETAVSALNKLISLDKVKFVIGPGISAAMLAVAPIAEKNHVLLMGTTCENSQISNAGDFIFRVYPSYTIHGKILARFSIERWKAKKAGIIAVQNDFGIDIAKEFTREFELLGGKVVVQENYVESASDFRAQLSKIKALTPDVVFLSSYIKEMPRILIEAKEIALKSRFVASSSFYDQKVLDMAAGTAEGVAASTSLYDINSIDPNVIKYVKEYEREFNKKPDYWSSYGYDAANVVMAAVEAVGPDPVKVKDYLYSMTPFPGVTGTLSFDRNGDVITDVRIVIVKDGKFKTVELVKRAP